jgi:hypothetical protein
MYCSQLITLYKIGTVIESIHYYENSSLFEMEGVSLYISENILLTDENKLLLTYKWIPGCSINYTTLEFPVHIITGVSQVHCWVC